MMAMSQNPILDYGTKSALKSGLKPELAAALGSLEVQLEQELTRYRRTRNGVRPGKKVSVESYVTNPPQQSNSTTGTKGNTQPSVVEFNKNEVVPKNSHLETEKQPEIPDINNVSGAYIQNNTTTVTPPPLPSLKSHSISSIVPTKPKTAESETLVPTTAATKHPDDYLESSEALLKSLQQEQTQSKKSSVSHDSLLSPLGIGSMLLLLLASLTLGYVVFNPQNFPKFDLEKLKVLNFSFSTGGENPQVVENNVAATSQPEITPIAKYPNLATREFPEVKDPNDIVGLKPKSKPTPTITPTPQPLISSIPLNPVIPPTPLPQLSVTPKPQEISPGLNANNKPSIKPSADGYYYLITDNQGDNALAKAQQVVPDAYLSPNKKYIYLGALKTEEEVKQRVEQLKAKGIKARVQEQ
jgi:hypothetical protein